MIIGSQIHNALHGSGPVAAIVSDRIYPVNTGAQQPATFPYIVFHLVGAESLKNMEGSSGLVFAHVQIDCWMNNWDYETLESLADAVRLALQNKRDLAGGFQHANLTNSGDLMPDTDVEAIGRFLEFQIALSEATS